VDKVFPNLQYWKGRREPAEPKRMNRVKPGPSRKLTRKEEMIMSLMRLKLGLHVKVLSGLFGVSPGKVSEIFLTWMNILACVLERAIRWPSQQTVQRYMPASVMKHYPNLRAIIDCTEFYIIPPRKPTAQSITYSTYKSHNTYKALLAVGPTAGFIFVSKIWGGNVSDRYIWRIVDLWI